MIPHGVRADPQLACDLVGRASPRELPEDFRLTRREPWVRRGRRVIRCCRELAKDANDIPTPSQRDRADLDIDPPAATVEEHALGIRGVHCAHDLLREELARTARVLRRNDRCVEAAANVPDHLNSGGVQPANDSGRVEHVAGDADRFERPFDVAPHLLQARHLFQCLPWRRTGQPPIACLTMCWRDVYRTPFARRASCGRKG